MSVPSHHDDGSLDAFAGFYAQRDDVREPYKGGFRYHPKVTAGECIDLLMRMTWKYAAMGLPFDGGKGDVAVSPKTPSDEKYERLTRRLTEGIRDVIRPKKDVPTPDMGTDSQEVAWFMDAYSIWQDETTSGVVTGKPSIIGGSYGREEAPDCFVAVVTRGTVDFYDWDAEDTIVTVQRLGSIDANAARLLDEWGAKTVTVPDAGEVICDPGGLGTQDTKGHDECLGMVSGYDAPELLSNGELLELDVDVLVPATIGNVTTTENVDFTSAEMVVEDASGSTAFTVNVVLEERRIPIIPDILTGANGMAVSHFEWLQDIDRRQWSLGCTHEELESEMLKAWDTIREHVEERDLMWRDTAYVVALSCIGSTERTRGLWPWATAR